MNRSHLWYNIIAEKTYPGRLSVLPPDSMPVEKGLNAPASDESRAEWFEFPRSERGAPKYEKPSREE